MIYYGKQQSILFKIVEENMTEYELPFENKYTYEHAKKYYKKHQGLRNQLFTAIECIMVKRALRLAGWPKVILDLPCGFGRFWKELITSRAEQIIVADKSMGMLKVAKEVNSEHILARTTFLLSTAMEIGLPDKSVDAVFCMRLLHHISDKSYRMAIYHSFQRVARESVLISLWNENSFRHSTNKKPTHKDIREVNRHFFNMNEIEAEFRAAGFKIIGYVDMLPYLSPWRTYVLKVNNQQN